MPKNEHVTSYELNFASDPKDDCDVQDDMHYERTGNMKKIWLDKIIVVFKKMQNLWI